MVVFSISLLNFFLFEVEELTTSVISKPLNKSFYLNPGYLIEENKNLFFLSYTNPYRINSLNYFNCQTKLKNWGLLIQNLDYPEYNEFRLSLNYANQIKNFVYGFSPNFCCFRIGKKSDFFLIYHLGFLYYWQKSSFSLAIFNINSPKVWSEEIGEKLICGIDLKLIKDLIFSIGYWQTKEDRRFKIGFHLSLIENLSFGQEFSFLPFNTNLKFDIQIKENIGLYYFLNLHHRLKDTHSFALYFSW